MMMPSLGDARSTSLGMLISGDGAGGALVPAADAYCEKAPSQTAARAPRVKMCNLRFIAVPPVEVKFENRLHWRMRFRRTKGANWCKKKTSQGRYIHVSMRSSLRASGRWRQV